MVRQIALVNEIRTAISNARAASRLRGEQVELTIAMARLDDLLHAMRENDGQEESPAVPPQREPSGLA